MEKMSTKTMICIKTIGMVALLIIITVLPSEAQRMAGHHIAIGIKGGTAGFGGDVTVSVNEHLNGRLTGTYFSYSMDGVFEDMDPKINYDVTGNVTSFGLLADYFPFKRVLNLSAGLYYHDFAITADAVPAESYTIDRKTFTPERIGSLSGTVDYNSKIVPYAGIGMGNPVSPGNRLTVNFELGAMYTNSPRVRMEGEGMIAPTASQGKKFEDGMSDFKFFPVLNLGLSFRL